MTGNERLTKIDGTGQAELICCLECHNPGNDNENCGCCEKPYSAYAKLHAFESIGTVTHYAELVKAEKRKSNMPCESCLYYPGDNLGRVECGLADCPRSAEGGE